MKYKNIFFNMMQNYFKKFNLNIKTKSIPLIGTIFLISIMAATTAFDTYNLGDSIIQNTIANNSKRMNSNDRVVDGQSVIVNKDRLINNTNGISRVDFTLDTRWQPNSYYYLGMNWDGSTNYPSVGFYLDTNTNSFRMATHANGGLSNKNSYISLNSNPIANSSLSYAGYKSIEENGFINIPNPSTINMIKQGSLYRPPSTTSLVFSAPFSNQELFLNFGTTNIKTNPTRWGPPLPGVFNTGWSAYVTIILSRKPGSTTGAVIASSLNRGVSTNIKGVTTESSVSNMTATEFINSNIKLNINSSGVTKGIWDGLSVELIPNTNEGKVQVVVKRKATYKSLAGICFYDLVAENVSQTFEIYGFIKETNLKPTLTANNYIFNPTNNKFFTNDFQFNTMEENILALKKAIIVTWKDELWWNLPPGDFDPGTTIDFGSVLPIFDFEKATITIKVLKSKAYNSPLPIPNPMPYKDFLYSNQSLIINVRNAITVVNYGNNQSAQEKDKIGVISKEPDGHYSWAGNTRFDNKDILPTQWREQANLKPNELLTLEDYNVLFDFLPTTASRSITNIKRNNEKGTISFDVTLNGILDKDGKLTTVPEIYKITISGFKVEINLRWNDSIIDNNYSYIIYFTDPFQMYNKEDVLGKNKPLLLKYLNDNIKKLLANLDVFPDSQFTSVTSSFDANNNLKLTDITCTNSITLPDIIFKDLPLLSLDIKPKQTIENAATIWPSTLSESLIKANTNTTSIEELSKYFNNMPLPSDQLNVSIIKEQVSANNINGSLSISFKVSIKKFLSVYKVYSHTFTGFRSSPPVMLANNTYDPQLNEMLGSTAASDWTNDLNAFNLLLSNNKEKIFTNLLEESKILVPNSVTISYDPLTNFVNVSEIQVVDAIMSNGQLGITSFLDFKISGFKEISTTPSKATIINQSYNYLKDPLFPKTPTGLQKALSDNSINQALIQKLIDVINPYSGDDLFYSVDIIKADDETGIIKIKFTPNKYLNSNGEVVNSLYPGNTTFEYTLYSTDKSTIINPELEITASTKFAQEYSIIDLNQLIKDSIAKVGTNIPPNTNIIVKDGSIKSNNRLKIIDTKIILDKLFDSSGKVMNGKFEYSFRFTNTKTVAPTTIQRNSIELPKSETVVTLMDKLNKVSDLNQEFIKKYITINNGVNNTILTTNDVKLRPSSGDQTSEGIVDVKIHLTNYFQNNESFSFNNSLSSEFTSVSFQVLSPKIPTIVKETITNSGIDATGNLQLALPTEILENSSTQIIQDLIKNFIIENVFKIFDNYPSYQTPNIDDFSEIIITPNTSADQDNSVNIKFDLNRTINSNGEYSKNTFKFNIKNLQKPGPLTTIKDKDELNIKPGGNLFIPGIDPETYSIDINDDTGNATQKANQELIIKHINANPSTYFDNFPSPSQNSDNKPAIIEPIFSYDSPNIMIDAKILSKQKNPTLPAKYSDIQTIIITGFNQKITSAIPAVLSNAISVKGNILLEEMYPSNISLNGSAKVQISKLIKENIEKIFTNYPIYFKTDNSFEITTIDAFDDQAGTINVTVQPNNAMTSSGYDKAPFKIMLKDFDKYELGPVTSVKNIINIADLNIPNIDSETYSIDINDDTGNAAQKSNQSTIINHINANPHQYFDNFPDEIQNPDNKPALLGPVFSYTVDSIIISTNFLSRKENLSLKAEYTKDKTNITIEGFNKKDTILKKEFIPETATIGLDINANSYLNKVIASSIQGNNEAEVALIGEIRNNISVLFENYSLFFQTTNVVGMERIEISAPEDELGTLNLKVLTENAMIENGTKYGQAEFIIKISGFRKLVLGEVTTPKKDLQIELLGISPNITSNTYSIDINNASGNAAQKVNQDLIIKHINDNPAKYFDNYPDIIQNPDNKQALKNSVFTYDKNTITISANILSRQEDLSLLAEYTTDKKDILISGFNNQNTIVNEKYNELSNGFSVKDNAILSSLTPSNIESNLDAMKELNDLLERNISVLFDNTSIYFNNYSGITIKTFHLEPTSNKIGEVTITVNVNNAMTDAGYSNDVTFKIKLTGFGKDNKNATTPKKIILNENNVIIQYNFINISKYSASQVVQDTNLQKSIIDNINIKRQESINKYFDFPVSIKSINKDQQIIKDIKNWQFGTGENLGSLTFDAFHLSFDTNSNSQTPVYIESTFTISGFNKGTTDLINESISVIDTNFSSRTAVDVFENYRADFNSWINKEKNKWFNNIPLNFIIDFDSMVPTYLNDSTSVSITFNANGNENGIYNISKPFKIIFTGFLSDKVTSIVINDTIDVKSVINEKSFLEDFILLTPEQKNAYQLTIQNYLSNNLRSYINNIPQPTLINNIEISSDMLSLSITYKGYKNGVVMELQNNLNLRYETQTETGKTLNSILSNFINSIPPSQFNIDYAKRKIELLVIEFITRNGEKLPNTVLNSIDKIDFSDGWITNIDGIISLDTTKILLGDKSLGGELGIFTSVDKIIATKIIPKPLDIYFIIFVSSITIFLLLLILIALYTYKKYREKNNQREVV